MTPTRIRLGSMLFATELLRPVMDGLGQGVTVTTLQLEDKDGKPLMDIEIRVTKLGSTKVSRNVKPLPGFHNLKDSQ